MSEYGSPPPANASPVKIKSETYTEVAGYIVRVLDCFVDMAPVLTAGLMHAQEDNEREAVESMTLEEKMQHDAHLSLFNSIIKFAPWFRDHILDPKTKLKAVIREVTQKISSHRSNDSGSLAIHIFSYAAHAATDGKSQTLDPSLNIRDPVELRGYQHPQLGYLLIWIKDLEDFKQNLQTVIDDYCECRRENLPTRFPLYIYDIHEWLAANNKNIEPKNRNPYAGFLKGSLLLIVWRHLFTTASSALAGRELKKGGGGKAASYRLTSIPPSTIAYAAVMIYSLLSDAKDWGHDMKSMSKEQLYKEVIAAFEDAPPAWLDNINLFWLSQVRLRHAPTTGTRDNRQHPSDVQEMEEYRRSQRLAREALQDQDAQGNVNGTPLGTGSEGDDSYQGSLSVTSCPVGRASTSPTPLPSPIGTLDDLTIPQQIRTQESLPSTASPASIASGQKRHRSVSIDSVEDLESDEELKIMEMQLAVAKKRRELRTAAKMRRIDNGDIDILTSVREDTQDVDECAGVREARG